MSINVARITEIHTEACTYGNQKLTGKELAFLDSIHAQSLRPGFTGLSAKQEAWFNALAKKLEATKGKFAFEVIAGNWRERSARRQANYYAAYLCG